MSRAISLLVCLLLGCGGGSRPKQRTKPSASANPGPTLILVSQSTGCGEGGAPSNAESGPDPSCAAGTPRVSFSRDVAPLVGCTGEICHGRWSYDALVNQASRVCCDHRPIVDPGRPSDSHLVQAVTGHGACVPRMGNLSDAEVAEVVAWICEGAPNN